MLLGFPIPSNSLGVILEHMFSDLSLEEILQAYYTNVQQLIEVFKVNFENYEKGKRFNFLVLKKVSQIIMVFHYIIHNFMMDYDIFTG